MSKKNILVVAENINYNRTSSGIRSFNLLNLLSNQYNVTCVCQELYDAEAPVKLRNVELIELKPGARLSPALELLDKIPKIRALSAYVTGLTLWGYRHIKDWQKAITKELNTKKYDLIFVLGTGHDFHAHHAIARLNTNVPIIAHIHDPYPYNQFPEPYKKEKATYVPLAKQFGKVMERADYISFPSLRLKEWMSNFYPVINEKSLLVPHPQCIIDVDAFEEKQYSSLELNDKFSLIHLGSLLGERNPLYLLKAFKTFCDSDPEKKEKARLYIVGRINGDHTNMLENEWGGFDNVCLVNDRIPYIQSKKIMAKSTALVILEAIADFSPFMPGKISDYIMAEKPIMALTPENSEVSRLLGKEHLYSGAVNDEVKILDILNRLWDAWKKEPNLKMDRQDLKQYISVEKSIEVFESVLNKK